MLPRPVQTDELEGSHSFDLSSIGRLVYPPALENTADMVRVMLADSPARKAGPSVLRLVEPAEELGAEAYELEVRGEEAVVSASDPAGFFYAMVTLRQICAAGRREAVTVKDAPRYAHRGLVLDVARQFLTVDEVLRVIDRMAMFKLNRLHLHLTDDQGWRIEIPAWPLLTAVGARHGVGGRPGGFYTLEDWSRIVGYAAERFVDVIPEIDLPGHVNAALVAYPELAPAGVVPEPYFGQRVGFSGLDLTNPRSFEFARSVLTYICRITPGPLVHIGGDECFETAEGEYAPFMAFAAEVVRAEGKRPVGWQEIAKDGNLSTSTLVQYWGPLREADQNTPPLQEFVVRGGRVIMSPADRAYLDVKPYESFPIGTLWWGRLDPLTLADTLLWDPSREIQGVGEDSIHGVEAAIWTEFVASLEELDQLLFPRLAAVAEVAWSAASETPPDLDDFRKRVERLAPAWEALGIMVNQRTLLSAR